MNDEFCYDHKRPIKKVFGWVGKSVGVLTFNLYCPKCYNLKRIKFVCKKCGYKNDYWQQEGTFHYKCRNCKDTGEVSAIGIYKREIPSWRLNIDDATTYDILVRKPEEFGIPYMSEQKWKQFYAQEREVRKVQEFNQIRRTLLKEGIRELLREKD